MTIHAIIKARRLALGWSHQELAAKVREVDGKPLSWQSVQQWEREGGTAPKRSRMPAVAQALGVPLALLAGVDAATLNPPDQLSDGGSAVDLDAALDRVGMELARDMPQTTRDELCDAMAGWARHRGIERWRTTVHAILTQPAADGRRKPLDSLSPHSPARIYRPDFSRPSPPKVLSPAGKGSTSAQVCAIDQSWGLFS